MTPMTPRLAHYYVEDMGCYRSASWVLRWYALLLDFTFFVPIDLLFREPFQRLIEQHMAYGHGLRSWMLTLLLIVLPLLVYVIAPTALSGQTLGKRIVGLRVIRFDGQAELSLSTVILRETIGKLLTVMTLGLGLLMLVLGKGRALHDWVAQTRVITYRGGEVGGRGALIEGERVSAVAAVSVLVLRT